MQHTQQGQQNLMTQSSITNQQVQTMQTATMTASRRTQGKIFVLSSSRLSRTSP